jgi:hypothetical protein
MKDKKQKKDKKPAQTQQKATQYFQKISTQEYEEQKQRDYEETHSCLMMVALVVSPATWATVGLEPVQWEPVGWWAGPAQQGQVGWQAYTQPQHVIVVGSLGMTPTAAPMSGLQAAWMSVLEAMRSFCGNEGHHTGDCTYQDDD